jgi:lysosomal Pro-X carboxypeptidase
MFFPSTFDPQAYTAMCQSTYGLTPQYDFALDYFGGRAPRKDFKDTSNIIFSNGDIDPWHSGGVLENVGNSTAIWILGSAHHFDLREPHPADDPATITAARTMEASII